MKQNKSASKEELLDYFQHLKLESLLQTGKWCIDF